MLHFTRLTFYQNDGRNWQISSATSKPRDKAAGKCHSHLNGEKHCVPLHDALNDTMCKDSNSVLSNLT